MSQFHERARFVKAKLFDSVIEVRKVFSYSSFFFLRNSTQRRLLSAAFATPIFKFWNQSNFVFIKTEYLELFFCRNKSLQHLLSSSNRSFDIFCSGHLWSGDSRKQGFISTRLDFSWRSATAVVAACGLIDTLEVVCVLYCNSLCLFCFLFKLTQYISTLFSWQ